MCVPGASADYTLDLPLEQIADFVANPDEENDVLIEERPAAILPESSNNNCQLVEHYASPHPSSSEPKTVTFEDVLLETVKTNFASNVPKEKRRIAKGAEVIIATEN
ncbi:hypothetical protein FQA39_LY06510 [Lamprigera yunnana]|nr:hypothetical protein FQA39_LY06510 [Lamprigera yunnana]